MLTSFVMSPSLLGVEFGSPHGGMKLVNKQRVLMHGHQGWNVQHSLCHIYMRYVYIWVVYSLCFFCYLFITVTWWYVWCFEWASGNHRLPLQNSDATYNELVIFIVFGLDHFIPYFCFIDTYVYLIMYWCFIVCWCFTTYWCFIFMYEKSETTWIKNVYLCLYLYLIQTFKSCSNDLKKFQIESFNNIDKTWILTYFYPIVRQKWPGNIPMGTYMKHT